MALLATVVNTPDFIAQVHQGQYSACYFQTDDNRYLRIGNDEIVRAIQSGEEYQRPPDNTIDLEARLARLGRGTVGGMTPPNPLITTNTRFFDEWRRDADALSLAAHWFHEWLHVAGLRHASKRPDFQDAVYQIGRMVVAVGRQRLALKAFSPSNGHPTPEPGQGYLDAYDQPADHRPAEYVPAEAG